MEVSACKSGEMDDPPDMEDTFASLLLEEGSDVLRELDGNIADIVCP